MKAKRHAGVVPAAGASTRMGSPKALLPAPSGLALALHQADLLERAGCERTVIVLGADAENLATKLNDERVVIHPDWRQGRVSSIQAGLSAIGEFDGYVVLPVDTIGVSLDAIRTILDHAERTDAEALRPASRGAAARLVWFSRRTADRILALEPTPSLRLDHILAPVQKDVDVGDLAIGMNVNTPEDWEEVRRRMDGMKSEF